MGRLLLIPVLLFLHAITAFPQATLTLRTQDQWGPGRFNRVAISVTFSSSEGFARLTQEYPEDFVIIPDSSAGCDIEAWGTLVSAVWMKMPRDKKAEIVYYVKPPGGMSGSLDLECRLDEVNDDFDRRTTRSGRLTVTVTGNNGMLPEELGKARKSVTKNSEEGMRVTERAGQSALPEFRIQISTSSAEKTAEKIRMEYGLPAADKITIVRSSGNFKYQVGDYSDYGAALSKLGELKKNGLKDAFIVAYIGSEQVPVAKARGTTR